MCITCTLIAANVQVCGVVVKHHSVGGLRAVSGASPAVLRMLTLFIRGKTHLPFPKKAHESVGSADSITDHSWTIEFISTKTYKLCFHATSSEPEDPCV